ncbi:MAG: helix-turn-helix transcriptional regulator, partial [Clostridia bacterium]
MSEIKDEIISSGERAYLITDDFTHVMGYSKEAVRLLTGICGEAISVQLENGGPCSWLPFLLGIDAGSAEEDGAVVKKLKISYSRSIHMTRA